MGLIQRKLKPCKTCYKPSYLWSHGECKKCAGKNKTNSKRTSIAPESEKRKREHKIYSTLRKLFLSNHPECEAKLSGCFNTSTDVHHKKGKIGALFLDVKHWLAVCRLCHNWIELNPIKSKELGLSESRLKTTDETDNN